MGWKHRPWYRRAQLERTVAHQAQWRSQGDLQVIEFICVQSGPQIADLLCIRASNAQAATIIWKKIMKIKNSKKLSLAKETLKILNAGDLARVQGGAYTLLNTVLSPELEFLGNTSNSL